MENRFRPFFERLGLPQLTTDYSCDNCASPVEYSDFFCRGCGAFNPNASEEAFTADFGRSVSDFREKECERGHPWLQKEADEECLQMMKDSGSHCWVCGEKVV